MHVAASLQDSALAWGKVTGDALTSSPHFHQPAAATAEGHMPGSADRSEQP
jgi:hypothetical protein